MALTETAPTDAPLPTWTIGDRMRKAREEAGISAKQMATRLDMHRNTISGYEHDRIEPKRPVLLVWARLTDVPVEWLTTGRDDMIPAQLRLSFAPAH